MQPIPSKVVSRGPERLEPVDGHTMNGGQITEDQIEELWPGSSVAVDERTHPFGVLSPGVADDENFGHILGLCASGIRGVHAVSPERNSFRNNRWSQNS